MGTPNTQRHYIYAEYANADAMKADKPRYIGRSTNLRKRFRRHTRDALRHGVKAPVYRTLETVHGPKHKAKRREQHHIDGYRRRGCSLTNGRNEIARPRDKQQHVSWNAAEPSMFRAEYDRAQADHEYFRQHYPNALGANLPMRTFKQWMANPDRPLEEVTAWMTWEHGMRQAQRLMPPGCIVIDVEYQKAPVRGGAEFGWNVRYVDLRCNTRPHWRIFPAWRGCYELHRHFICERQAT